MADSNMAFAKFNHNFMCIVKNNQTKGGEIF